MNVVSDEGIVLDANFSLQDSPLGVVYESGGGARGVNARNTQYIPGLNLILRRLRDAGATITDVRVESQKTQALAIDERRVRLGRYTLPVDMSAVDDIDDLRKDI